MNKGFSILCIDLTVVANDSVECNNFIITEL